MEMISDEDRRIGWDEVFDVITGVLLVLHRCFRSMDSVPAWAYVITALFALAAGIAALLYYRNRQKKGKRRILGFFFGVLFILWGLGFILKALSVL